MHDVWTLSPGLSFGRKGGENSTRLKFEDTISSASASSSSLERSSNVDRSAWRARATSTRICSAAGGRSRPLTLPERRHASRRCRLSAVRFTLLDSRWSADTSALPTRPAPSRATRSANAVERFEMRRATVRDRRRLFRQACTTAGPRAISAACAMTRAHSRRARRAHCGASRPIAPWPIRGSASKCSKTSICSTRNLDQIGRHRGSVSGPQRAVELGFAVTAFGSTRDGVDPQR